MNVPPEIEEADAESGVVPGAAGGIDAGLDPNLSLTGKKLGRGPLVLAALLAAAGVGVVVWRGAERQHTRELHAAVMQRFADVEKQDVVGKLWACLLGDKADPSTFPNNLALSQRLESAAAGDPSGYPAKVRDSCVPMAREAARAVAAISAPDLYRGALDGYGASVSALGDAFDRWSRSVPAHIAEREVGRKVGVDGGAWHAFDGGKASAEVIAYDRFLHCAVPGVDKLKNGQQLVEQLFKQCKDPRYLERLQNVCGKEVSTEGVPQLATPGLRTALAHLQGDDRELSAFDDCLRRARKGHRNEDDEAVGRAWLAYMEAGRKVRAIGKDALADK